MKITAYFESRRLIHKVTRQQVQQALDNEVEREVQEDGRIRIYGWIAERGLYMRVVLLEDGETVLNAFFDDNYSRKRSRQ